MSKKRIKAYPIKSPQICAKCKHNGQWINLGGYPIKLGGCPYSSGAIGMPCKNFERCNTKINLTRNSVELTDNEGNMIAKFTDEYSFKVKGVAE